MLLDNNGNVVNQITYDAFGNITAETNSDVNFRFSYTGREFDPETGLYNYRARYYDLAVGRFISIDPIGFAAGDSNLYRYVGNNPLFYLDPSGFCGVGSSGGGNGNNDTPDFFDPGFDPGSTPSPFSDGGGDNNGDGGDDFWEGLSDFFFPPASAAEPPPLGFDSQFDTPNDNASDVIDNLDLNYDFPGDDSTEVALAVPIAAGIGIGLGILTIGEAYRRHLELQQELNKDDDGYEYYDWERYHQPLETTVKDNTGEFDSTIIDTFEGDFEINRDVERFPGADDFLDADNYTTFPDGDYLDLNKPIPDFENNDEWTPTHFDARIADFRTARNNAAPVPPNSQTHHLVPDRSAQNSDLAMEALQRGQWDINGIDNLINLPSNQDAYDNSTIKIRHSGSHPVWNDHARDVLERTQTNLESQYGSLDKVLNSVLEKTMDNVEKTLRNDLNDINKGKERGWIKKDKYGMQKLSSNESAISFG